MSKYLILTGGSQGIGKATIAYFIKQGWQAFNLSRHPCDVIGVTNISIDFLQSDWSSVISSDLLPKLNNATQISLIHNAAIFIADAVGSIDASQLQQSLQLNVMVPALLNNFFIPIMPKGSSIIYIGSTLSEKAVAGCATYTISKHSLIGLMRATCQDMAGKSIYTCCICPGVTDTSMLRERCQHNEDILEQLKNLSVDQRLIAPEEIAYVIWFCANTPVINGTVIHANSGQKET